MGADMRAVIECEIDKDELWHCIALLNVDRNYHLFGLINGVRSNDNPIIEPRGWPDFMSQESNMWMLDELHEPTWLTFDELTKVLNRYKEIVPERCFQLEAWLTLMNHYESSGDKTRIIFACDQG